MSYDANHINIFHDLTVDEFHNLDIEKEDQLLGNYYEAFTRFCHFMKTETREDGHFAEVVKSLSSEMTENGIRVNIQLIDGSTEEIVLQ